MVEDSTANSTINYVKIQSLIESHVILFGRASGRRYDWIKAGDIVQVLEQDASDVLKKRFGKKTCCGGNNYNKIFQLVL